MNNIECRNFKPDSCAASGQKTVCRGMQEACEFPELYQPKPTVEAQQTLSLDYVSNRIEVEDRTISFLYRQLEELRADRHYWLGVRKQILKNGGGVDEGKS